MLGETRLEEQITALGDILKSAEYEYEDSKGQKWGYYFDGWAGRTLRGLLDDLKARQPDGVLDALNAVAPHVGTVISPYDSWDFIEFGEKGTPSYCEMMVPGSYREI